MDQGNRLRMRGRIIDIGLHECIALAHAHRRGELGIEALLSTGTLAAVPSPLLLRSTPGLGREPAGLEGRHGPDRNGGEPILEGKARWRP